MKKIIITVVLSSLISACYHQSVIPLGNDMMEIDVSAAPVYGRAGAMSMALTRAANATIAAGFDKFIVLDNKGWNELQAVGGSYGSYNGSYGNSGSSFSVMGKPEVKMVIRMFHEGDTGSEKAVDARAVLKQTN